jgi:hypothetical protein
MQSKTFHLPTPLLEKLKALAEKRGVPMGEVVRQAVHEYVERNKS